MLLLREKMLNLSTHECNIIDRNSYQCLKAITLCLLSIVKTMQYYKTHHILASDMSCKYHYDSIKNS